MSGDRPETFQFTIHGDPEPMPRPKTGRRGKFTHAYYPSGPWEKWRNELLLLIPRRPIAAWDGLVRVLLTFRLSRPKSLPRRFEDSYCPRKPDLDNYTKLVFDVLQKRGWFTDDGRICESSQRKIYSGQPGLAVAIQLFPIGARPLENLAFAGLRYDSPEAKIK